MVLYGLVTGKTGKSYLICLVWFANKLSRYLCSDICWLKLTIVTSSIFEILLTKMLTRTTAGPSAILFGFFFRMVYFVCFRIECRSRFFFQFDWLVVQIFVFAFEFVQKWREFQQTRNAEVMYRDARTHTHKRNVSVCGCVTSAEHFFFFEQFTIVDTLEEEKKDIWVIEVSSGQALVCI